MCLLIVASRVVDGTPLVLAGNRDERFDRPAEPMAVLRADRPRTLGGRDSVAGGTWLAVNRHGVVAGLTNRPSPGGIDRAKRSRGELPLALTSRPTAELAVADFVEHHRPGDYNPAWLLVGDRRSLFSVDMTGVSATISELPPGIHVLENHPLGAPSIKVDHVRGLVADVDGPTAGDLDRRLRQVLADHRVPDVAGASAEEDRRERPAALRAPCVHTAEFGTRWSGIVTIPDDEAQAPGFVYTEGPPCVAPFLDASGHWH